MKRILLLLVPAFVSCSEYVRESPVLKANDQPVLSLEQVASIISCLPMGQEHLEEVYSAASSSSVNGYDEEYTFSDLFSSPGAGVGDSPAKAALKAGQYTMPMRDLFGAYFSGIGTKNGLDNVPDGYSAEECIKFLTESDIQIYTPFADDWDGKTYPVITFDPGYGATSNYGFEIRFDDKGNKIIDSVYVDEAVAERRPVWVVNRNDDAAFTPMDLVSSKTVPESPVSGPAGAKTCSADAVAAGAKTCSADVGPAGAKTCSADVCPAGAKTTIEAASGGHTLMLKSFTMLRQYDSWFGGASEFFIKCGSCSGFKATTDAELKYYTPSVTDMMLVVKRKYLKKELPVDAILVSDFTDSIENLAFIIVEDDGGTRTSWKCSATVKYKSKSYGFDIEIPFNEKDDIVWRGQLSSSFFGDGETVTGRFGDVKVTFAKE